MAKFAKSRISDGLDESNMNESVSGMIYSNQADVSLAVVANCCQRLEISSLTSLKKAHKAMNNNRLFFMISFQGPNISTLLMVFWNANTLLYFANQI